MADGDLAVDETDCNLLLVGGLSRSGTTLLSSIFAAHPDVAAGAELIPTPIADNTDFRAKIERAFSCTADFALVGRSIRAEGDKSQGSIATRCYRAGATIEELYAVIDSFSATGRNSIETFEDRFQFAVRIIAERMAREQKTFGSFKINTPSITPVLATYRNAYAACIVRHPADVVDSHLRNNFGKSPGEICKAWVNYLTAFELARRNFPDRTIIIRYEDLVTDPERCLGTVFATVPLAMSAELMNFHEKETNITRSRHPNTVNLKRGFFGDSVGISRGKMASDICSLIEDQCGPALQKWFPDST